DTALLAKLEWLSSLVPDHVITEAKYNKARLGKTSDGKQMSDPWVTDKRLKKAGLSKIERDNILESLEDEDGAVQKLLIHNKPDGSLIVKELGKNAQVVGNPFGL
ncbi:hypothetical protein, partial [Pseudoalteromonas sp. S558]|uniref:hypothetical protein n=1 Tax=Pseudoalteromonas sp. S558 TaxID=2066515 RepID=UPI00127E39EC